MAYSAKVGSFNIDSSITATNTQAVTGVGFTPKVVLFWWSGSTATGDSVAGGDINAGFGAAISSSSRACTLAYSQDAAAASLTYNAIYNSACIVEYTAGVTGLADFNSLDADGFTLTIDDQFASDLRVSYLALGGTDLTNVAIGTLQQQVSTGNFSVTGVGFQPDALLFGTGYRESVNSPGAGAQLTLGMATASDKQGLAGFWCQTNQATSNTSGYGYGSECIWSDPYDNRAAFVSFGADGFTLNQVDAYKEVYSFYVALKGGQYEVGNLTTRTDSNDIEENLAGAFEPVAVLFASANAAVDTSGSYHDHARLSIGAGTSTSNRAVQAISDEDNLADTETAFTNQDDAVYAHVVDDAIVALMDIKSIDADGFTCVMDDAEDSACWVTYLAIGAAAAGGGVISEIATVSWANVGQFAGVAEASIAQVAGVVAN